MFFQKPKRRGVFVLRYYLLAFLSGAFTMTLELVASRLIAPYVGVSLRVREGFCLADAAGA